MAIRGLPRHSWPITLHASHQGASHHGACIPRMHPPRAPACRHSTHPRACRRGSHHGTLPTWPWQRARAAGGARTRTRREPHGQQTSPPWRGQESSGPPAQPGRRFVREAIRGKQKMQSEDAIRRCNQKMRTEDAIKRQVTALACSACTTKNLARYAYQSEPKSELPPISSLMSSCNGFP